MSTRATYRFIHGQFPQNPVTLYVHHDGYPTGAAVYFYDTLCNPSKGCMATQMIRAVPGAEITDGHDSHGDTNYQYDITGVGPTARIVATKIPFDGKPYAIFQGALHEFIKNNSKDIVDFKPFKPVKLDYSEIWLNELSAQKYLEQEYGVLYCLRQWGTKEPQSKPYVDKLNTIVDVFPELRQIYLMHYLV